MVYSEIIILLKMVILPVIMGAKSPISSGNIRLFLFITLLLAYFVTIEFFADFD